MLCTMQNIELSPFLTSKIKMSEICIMQNMQNWHIPSFLLLAICRTSSIKISILWIIQNLEICKYQGFYIVHHVKCKIDFHYEREILQFLYFASSKICRLSKLSIFCTSSNMELSSLWISKMHMSLFCNMQKSKVFKYHAFYIEHNAKNGICNHYERQISKVPYFEQCKI